MIAAFTLAGVAINFLGVNPMKTLVFAGVVQGFSAPPLMFLIMRMAGSRVLVGNSSFATAGLVWSWL